MKSVPVADLGRTVQEFAHAPTMELVIQLTGLVNVTLAGLVVTVLSLALLPTGALTVSIPAIATMELDVVPMTGNANVHQDGLVSTVLRDVLWDFTEGTVH